MLAAGCGDRMGEPKAGMLLNGKPSANIQAELLLSGGCSHVVIVLGFNAGEITENLQPLPNDTRIVVNHEWEQGQFSSLQAGLIGFDAGICLNNRVVVLPVDTLGLNPTTISTVLSVCDNDCDAVVPVFAGKSGHPVALSGKICNYLLNQDSKKSRLDWLLREMNVKYVEVDDEAVLNNANRPEDL